MERREKRARVDDGRDHDSAASDHLGGPRGNASRGLLPAGCITGTVDPQPVPSESTTLTPPIPSFLRGWTIHGTHNRDFILGLGPGSDVNPIYDLAGQLYAMVAFQEGYSFWDTVATAWLQEPGLFSSTERSLVAITRGAEQGTILEGDCATLVDVAETVDVQSFYAYLMDA